LRRPRRHWARTSRHPPSQCLRETRLIADVVRIAQLGEYARALRARRRRHAVAQGRMQFDQAAAHFSFRESHLFAWATRGRPAARGSFCALPRARGRHGNSTTRARLPSRNGITPIVRSRFLLSIEHPFLRAARNLQPMARTITVIAPAKPRRLHIHARILRSDKSARSRRWAGSF